ncbi:MAG: hypothetical protein V1726_05305 [Methanobacteriota archaeon]
MKRKIIIGSIGAILIVVLASFSSVASAQTIKSTVDEKTSLIQNIVNKKDNLASGGIIQMILTLIGGCIGLILFFWFFLILYSIGAVAV